MHLHIIIAGVLITLASLASFSYADDTEYFDISFPIDYQTIQESDWSDEGSFTISDNETPPPQGADTEYFDIAFTVDYTEDGGGGWTIEDDTDVGYLLIAATVAILFPLAVIVKYRNGKGWRLRR